MQLSYGMLWLSLSSPPNSCRRRSSAHGLHGTEPWLGNDFLQHQDLQYLKVWVPREGLGKVQRMLFREPPNSPGSHSKKLRGIVPPFCAVKLGDVAFPSLEAHHLREQLHVRPASPHSFSRAWLFCSGARHLVLAVPHGPRGELKFEVLQRAPLTCGAPGQTSRPH